MASALATAYGAVRTAAKTALGSLAVSWWNDPWTPPTPDTPWVAVRFVGGEGQAVTQLPTAGNERHALLQFDYYVPENAGSGDAETALDGLATTFSRLNAYPVLFGVASTPKEVDSDQYGWLRLTLTVPFTVEETA
jgi:hypothetical protein